MNYYCQIICFNSRNDMLLVRPKIRSKEVVNNIAQQLNTSYKLVIICHNEAKGKILWQTLRCSEFFCRKVISIV